MLDIYFVDVFVCSWQNQCIFVDYGHVLLQKVHVYRTTYGHALPKEVYVQY